MPKIEFVTGIQCKQCGHIVAPVTIYTKELCQKCGTQILHDVDRLNMECTYTRNAEKITVKVIHKLFYNILKRVDLGGI